mgnify:FL=1
MYENNDFLGVLFDMDGTLLDSEKIWDVAVAELSLELGRELTAEVRESTLGNSMHGALRKVFAHTGTDATDSVSPGTAKKVPSGSTPSATATANSASA